MVGQPTVTTKPSRSDEVLDAVQQLEITNKVRAHFESMVPKRPTKPNRSEPDSIIFNTPSPDADISVPELDKLRSLQSQSQAISIPGAIDEVQEEFVETQYYKELHSVDKQHHTTGTGFIKVASEMNGNGYKDLQLKRGHGDAGGVFREMVFKTNPATNDWIPNLEDNQVAYLSSKPNRSESC